MTPNPVGTRVVVRSPRLWHGRPGVIVPMLTRLLNGHDCAVMLDGATSPLCFYWHELEVEA